nr:hypothetical protein [Vampirovibrio sp.]
MVDSTVETGITKSLFTSNVRLPVILHVDDDPLVLQATKRYFQQSRYHLLSAQSGYEALCILL